MASPTSTTAVAAGAAPPEREGGASTTSDCAARLPKEDRVMSISLIAKLSASMEMGGACGAQSAKNNASPPRSLHRCGGGGPRRKKSRRDETGH